MITESFDNTSEAIISPRILFGEQNRICDLAIGTFSREIWPAVLEKYPHEQIAEIRAANRIKPIYLLTVDGMKVVFYLSEIGSAMAATDVIEINWKTGAERFILFGSAGALDREATAGKYVIPTEAYRDEGMSQCGFPGKCFCPAPSSVCKRKSVDHGCPVYGNTGAGPPAEGGGMYCRGNGTGRRPGSLRLPWAGAV